MTERIIFSTSAPFSFQLGTINVLMLSLQLYGLFADQKRKTIWPIENTIQARDFSLSPFCFPFISCWFGYLYLNVLYEWFFLLISHTRTGLYSLQSTSSSSNKKNVLTEIRIKQQEIMSIIKLQLSIHNKPLDYPKPFSWWTNQPNSTLICYRKERNNDQTTSI